jgi:hypothetical protein
MSLKISILTIFYVATIGNINAQAISKEDFTGLSKILNAGMNKYFVSRKTAPSEFLFVILQTDSTGKVKSVNMLGDHKNIDSAYTALDRLTVSDFKGWKVASCRNKTIIIPVISGGDQGGYVENIFGDLFWSRQNQGSVLKQDRNTIVTNIINHIKDIYVN